MFENLERKWKDDYFDRSPSDFGYGPTHKRNTK